MIYHQEVYCTYMHRKTKFLNDEIILKCYRFFSECAATMMNVSRRSKWAENSTNDALNISPALPAPPLPHPLLPVSPPHPLLPASPPQPVYERHWRIRLYKGANRGAGPVRLSIGIKEAETHDF
jgi:hypothetical protein